ncbi:hypothetical protein CcCBS67573_g07173 [Chytriomyces confervae]|uniref:Cyclic nucleotide-binding domain-containing protein n=1 Tax=Chytriomyces confervae TaxID=246404 RepID=A0A507EWM0_9FUNG|nr:hypothetical protein CcCBS67573_g07173 [Chytriomyces confervae]
MQSAAPTLLPDIRARVKSSGNTKGSLDHRCRDAESVPVRARLVRSATTNNRASRPSNKTTNEINTHSSKPQTSVAVHVPKLSPPAALRNQKRNQLALKSFDRTFHQTNTAPKQVETRDSKEYYVAKSTTNGDKLRSVVYDLIKNRDGSVMIQKTRAALLEEKQKQSITKSNALEAAQKRSMAPISEAFVPANNSNNSTAARDRSSSVVACIKSACAGPESTFNLTIKLDGSRQGSVISSFFSASNRCSVINVEDSKIKVEMAGLSENPGDGSTMNLQCRSPRLLASEQCLLDRRASSYGSLARSTSMRSYLGSTFITDVAVDHSYGKSEMFFRLRRMFRLVALASHFTKYLSKILKNPVQWGWEYDPDANFEESVAITSSSKNRNIVSAVDFSVGHLFSKNQFQGWLTPNMRTLFRKPPETRTDLDLSEMQIWSSSMKAFSKYPVSIQKELLTVGRYERWHSERMIVGESQKGMFFYVILDGEIEMFKMDQEKMDADRILAGSRAASKNPTPMASTESLHQNARKPDLYARQYRVQLGTQTSGESFGELAFFNESLRLATAATTRTTEFFLVAKDDYLRIVKDINQKVSSEKLQFMEKFPILKTLSGSLETVGLYCEFKSFSPETVIIAEGAACESIFLLKSGTCRVIKSVHFLKTRMHRNTFQLEPITPSSAGLAKQVMQSRAIKSAPSQSDRSQQSIETKFLVIHQLKPGAYYFDGEDDAANTTAPARTGGVGKVLSKASVVSNQRVEFLVMSKVDFNKFATRETWKMFSEDGGAAVRKKDGEAVSTDNSLPPVNQLSDVYLENRRWAAYKQKVVSKIVAEIHAKRK